MPDLLIRLYDLPQDAAAARLAAAGVVVRRALPPERELVLDWIGARFPRIWVSEAAVALSHLPVRCWIAVKDEQLVGFACHDATAKGFFGPTGVDAEARGQGIGEALLLATLKGMREAGYAYGVIGAPGPLDFYKRRLDAFEIPGSEPGAYRGMLRPGD